MIGEKALAGDLKEYLSIVQPGVISITAEQRLGIMEDAEKKSTNMERDGYVHVARGFRVYRDGKIEFSGIECVVRKLPKAI